MEKLHDTQARGLKFKILRKIELAPPAATLELRNFLGQLDHRQGSLALLTLRPRVKDTLTELAGNYVLPVDRLDLLSAVQLLVAQTAGLFSKIPPRPPTPAEKKLLADFAQHLGFNPAALPQLASLKDLAEACHRHPKLLELALGDLRRPTANYAQVMQRLQNLSGKDLQARVDEMLGNMLAGLQAEAPAAFALLQIMTIFRGTSEVEALAAVQASEEAGNFNEALNAAVDSSLLSADNGRLWLHSLTAQFLEKHAPLPEPLANTYRRRHAEYYLEKARQYKKNNMEQWRTFDVDWENISTAADWVAELSLEQKEHAELVGNFALALKDVIYWRKLPAEKWLLAGAAAFARLENKKNEALMYNQIGLIYDARGDYDAALQWYQKSVAIKETLGDRAGLAASYNNIGMIHDARGNYDVALEWYQKSVAIGETLGDRAGLATSYNNIGLIYKAHGDYDAALQWYMKDLEITETLGDRAGLAASYNNIGEVHRARGDYDAALQWYQKSIAISETLNNRAGLATSYSNIGGIYYARKDFSSALNWLMKAIQIIEQIGDRPHLAQAFENAGALAMAQQDWPTALAYFTRSRELYQQLGLEKKVREEEELIAEVKKKIG